MDETADSQLEIKKSEKAALRKLRQLKESPHVADASDNVETPTTTPGSITPSPQGSAKSIFAGGSKVQKEGTGVVTKASAPPPNEYSWSKRGGEQTSL